MKNSSDLLQSRTYFHSVPLSVISEFMWGNCAKICSEWRRYKTKGKSFITLKAFSEKSPEIKQRLCCHLRLCFEILLELIGSSLTKIFPFKCNSDGLTCWFWVDFYTCTYSPKQPIIATVDPVVQPSCQTFVQCLWHALLWALRCAASSTQW